MKRFTQWLKHCAVYTLENFLMQMLAFFAFCIAVLVGVYFSTIYAGIAVFILASGLGIYLYGVVEKKIRDKSK